MSGMWKRRGITPCLSERARPGHRLQNTRGRRVLAHSKGWTLSGYANLGPWQGGPLLGRSLAPFFQHGEYQMLMAQPCLPITLKLHRMDEGDESLTLTLQDFRAGLKERPCKVPSPLLWHSQATFPAGLQAVTFRVQCQNLEEKARKTSFILLGDGI